MAIVNVTWLAPAGRMRGQFETNLEASLDTCDGCAAEGTLGLCLSLPDCTGIIYVDVPE